MGNSYDGVNGVTVTGRFIASNLTHKLTHCKSKSLKINGGSEWGSNPTMVALAW
jgi:hypothetical protein